MSVANFSRWANATHRYNGSQTSLISSTSDRSICDDNSSTYSETGDYGTLIIVIMKAKNLFNKRAISKQNPYCSVRVAKHSDRTKAITRGGQAPLWDHETRFRLNSDDDNRQLKLCVFDQNGSNTEIIGDALIPLQPAFEAPTDVGYDNWFPIHFNKRYVGEVYLEMTFYPKRKSSGSKRSSIVSTGGNSSKSFAPFLHSSVSTGNLSSGSITVAPPPPPPPPSQTSISPYSSSPPSRSRQGHSSQNLHHNLPPPVPQHLANIPASAIMKHSESMPTLRAELGSPVRLPSPGRASPPGRSPSPLGFSTRTRTGPRTQLRPLPQPPIPHPVTLQPPIPQIQEASAQEDIQRQINDGYEASLFERLKPYASQPFYKG